MDHHQTDDFSWFFNLLPVVLAVVFLGYIVRGAKPSTPLASTSAFGCYRSPDAPNILLGGNGLQVQQPNYPLVPFHLERTKTGIVLAADAPISAARAATGYRFDFHERGDGLYLPFRIENARGSGVFDPARLTSFSMIADDGTELSYTRAEPEACG